MTSARPPKRRTSAAATTDSATNSMSFANEFGRPTSVVVSPPTM